MVFGIGVNDMYGWYSKSEYNKRVYTVWHGMLLRCYSEKFHEKHPYYKGCYVCEKWLKLSGFVEDIAKIDGYEYWLNNPNQKIALDKDIKSNGKNKCYCLENCMFVSQSENSRQANATRDYNNISGKKNGMYGVHRYGTNSPKLGSLVARYDLDKNLIDIAFQFEYVKKGFNAGHITECCKGKRKKTGGFIFRYATDDDINQYIIKTKQIKIE